VLKGAALGRVKLFRAGTGAPRRAGDTFYVSRPLKLHTGDFFGELAPIENAPRSAEEIATADVTAPAIGHTAFKRLLRSEAAFTHAILDAAVGRLRNDQRTPPRELDHLAR
jgi:CRP-like cAMP-binding protein